MAARLALTTLFLVIPLIQGRSFKSEWKDVLLKCNDGKELPPEVAEKLNTHSPMKLEEVQCVLECVYKDFGMLKDGEIDVEAAKEVVKDFIPEGVTRDIAFAGVDFCKEQVTFKDQNQCEAVVNYQNCFNNHMTTHQKSFKARSKYILSKCNSGNPIPEETLKKMNTPLPVDTDEEKCLFGCVMKHFGMLGDDGLNEEVTVEVVKEFIPEGDMRTKALQGIQTCKEGTKGQTECETGGHFHNCMTNLMTAEAKLS